jgi:hypothetical protein
MVFLMNVVLIKQLAEKRLASRAPGSESVPSVISTRIPIPTPISNPEVQLQLSKKKGNNEAFRYSLAQGLEKLESEEAWLLRG